jgi:microcystin-dependent protein
VRLSGSIGGSTMSPIFTLPAGFRIPVAKTYTVNSSNQLGIVAIDTNGDVRPFIGLVGNVQLDGIEFDTLSVTAMPTGPQGPQGPPGTGVAFVGQICPTAFSTPEPGWLICDGTELAPGQHPTLRAKLVAEGSKFGTGISGGPLLPDLQNRFVRGGFFDVGTNPVGTKGGADTVALKMAEMPAHNHGGSTGVDSPDHAHYSQSGTGGGFLAYGGGGNGFMYVGNPWGAQGTGPFVGQIATGGASAQHSHSVPVAGGGAVNAGTPSAHENKPPYLTLYYAIYAGD